MAEQLRPEEISSILKGAITDYDNRVRTEEVGQVLDVGDGIARVHGLSNVMYQEMLEFEDVRGEKILGLALNEVFVPILRRQFPEIVDFYLPPEGCSYRMAVVTMKKQYPGHAKRVMMGVWSFLRQFMYTKFVVVLDDDVSARDWQDVIWAITTRMDPARDTVMVENTPIDYLDFASPVAGLGSKMGLDATDKWPGETDREWGTPIVMDEAVKARVSERWDELGIDTPDNHKRHS